MDSISAKQTTKDIKAHQEKVVAQTQVQPTVGGVPKKKKSKKLWFWCCLGCFTPILFIIVVVLYLAVASGVANIQVLRAMFYHPPKPSHEIVYSPGAADAIDEIVSGKNKTPDLNRVVVTSKGTGIKITETELSSLLFEKFKDNLRTFQVAVYGDKLEVWGELNDPNVVFLATGDVDLIMDVTKIRLFTGRVGSIGIPASFLTGVSDAVNEELAKGESSSAGIKSIEKYDGYMIVYFDESFFKPPTDTLPPL